MRIDYERQSLRALMALPIRLLPSYADDDTVTCRVGKAVAAHVLGPWDQELQSSLETSLHEVARIFLYTCPISHQIVQAMVDRCLIGPATVCAPMDCPICERSHIVYVTDEIPADAARDDMRLN